MKTLTQIIHSYANDGHKVDGLFLVEVQGLLSEEIIKIIENARGRDIIVERQDTDFIDGQWYGYRGSIDPDFNFGKYLK